MSDLFGEIDTKEVIRTLGLYQPFGSLMLHGKVETRWIRQSKKPPFPLGKYLLYTTQKSCTQHELFDWCGKEIMYDIGERLKNEPTKNLNGYALCYADLVHIDTMRLSDEEMCFVKFKGVIQREDKNGFQHNYVQRLLFFKNIERIEPYLFTEGKQGVGILKIKP